MKFVGEAWSVSSYAFQVIACCFEGKQLVTLLKRITQLLIPSPQCLTLALNVPLFFFSDQFIPVFVLWRILFQNGKTKICILGLSIAKI